MTVHFIGAGPGAADLITLPVCFNGVQVDDADSTDCNGLSVGPS